MWKAQISDNMEKFLDEVKNYWKGFTKNITFEKMMVRLVMSWLLTTILMLYKSGESFNTAALAAGINIPMYICFIVLFLFAICFSI